MASQLKNTFTKVQDNLSALYEVAKAQSEKIAGKSAGTYIPAIDSTNTIGSMLDSISGAVSAVISGGTGVTSITEGNGITVTNPSSSSPTVAVKINTTTNETLVADSNGLATEIFLSGITQSAESQYVSQYCLVDKNGKQIGDKTIDINKDQFLESVTFHETAETGVSVEAPYLKFIWKLSSGVTTPTYVSVKKLVDTYTGESGVAVNGYKISGVIDTVNNATDGFLKLGTDGFYTEGIKTKISEEISGKMNAFAEAKTAGFITKTNGTSASIDASAFKFGDTTSASFGASDEVAVESAVTGYVTDLINTNIAGVDTHVAIFDGTNKVKDSDRTVGSDSTTAANFAATEKVLATEKAVSTFVEDGLTTYQTTLDELKVKIDALK